MMKDTQLSKRVVDALFASEWRTEKTKDNGRTLSPLICPVCGNDSAYVFTAAPWVIICNRLNNCGAHSKIREFCPDPFISIEKRYAPTKEDPQKPATVYLHSRGLKQSLAGLHYEYWKNVRKTGSGAVMFPVASNGGVYNGRLFSPPPGEGKTHNKGSTYGRYWKHPGVSYDGEKETFIVEAIIDALALFEMGCQAIAVLAAGQNPKNLDLSEFKKPVIAFDNDYAGQQALKKWFEHFKKQGIEAGAIMPGSGGDWNDLLVSRGEIAQKFFKDNRGEFNFNALLSLAPTAAKYAETYFQHKGFTPGLFSFDGCYYYAGIKAVGREDRVMVSRQSNFTLKVDHYQLNTSDQDRPEYQYHLVVKPHSGRSSRFSVTADEIAQPNQQTKTFLCRARVHWLGERKASAQLLKTICEAPAPVVRQIQTIGHDKETGCYVFRHYMIKPGGEVVLPNDKGFFEVTHRKYIRPPSSGVVDKLVKPVQGKNSVAVIYDKLVSTWGNLAAVGFAWMLGAWFVHDISYRLGFYPFLSFYGDPGTGKSSLIHLMQLIQGVDGEGLPMTRVNTSKGKIRELAQRSSLFHALLESNAGENSRFDFDQFLTLYNFGALQTRAKKTTGLEVETIPYKAATLFGQNYEGFAGAMRERVISVKFASDQIISESSRAQYDQLKTIPRSELACVLPAILKHRNVFEAQWFKLWDEARSMFLVGQGNSRVEENHALVLAFHWIFSDLFKIDYDINPFVLDLTRLKIKEVEHRPSGLADFFFDVVFDLVASKGNDAKRFVDWPGLKNGWASLEPPEAGMMFFNLNKVMDLHGQFRASVKDLQSALREHPAYVESNKAHRFWRDAGEDPRTQKAWVFDLEKIPRTGDGSGPDQDPGGYDESGGCSGSGGDPVLPAGVKESVLPFG